MGSLVPPKVRLEVCSPEGNVLLTVLVIVSVPDVFLVPPDVDGKWEGFQGYFGEQMLVKHERDYVVCPFCS